MHLIVVYNADSGYVNATIDSLHKVVSPATYDCSLCKLTHGVFNEKEAWSRFLNETEHTFTFLHRNQAEEHRVAERFEGEIEYPCILQHNEGTLTYLIDPETLSKLNTLDELIDMIRERAAAHKQN